MCLGGCERDCLWHCLRLALGARSLLFIRMSTAKPANPLRRRKGGWPFSKGRSNGTLATTRSGTRSTPGSIPQQTGSECPRRRCRMLVTAAKTAACWRLRFTTLILFKRQAVGSGGLIGRTFGRFALPATTKLTDAFNQGKPAAALARRAARLTVNRLGTSSVSSWTRTAPQIGRESFRDPFG